jgi:ABC-type oligopeptide transport system ATPase subunit
MEQTDILLKVDGLCQYFGATKAVDGVSFEIYKGEVFGLVGESGCGKTTTGRSIIGLYDITAGEIFFEGQRIAGGSKRRKSAKNRKRTTDIQMIFQDPVASLNPRMTVKEIIAEGLVIRGIKDKALIDAKVYEILELV